MELHRLTKHLCAALERALANKPARPPEAGRLLWQAFGELGGTRTYSMAGPNPLQPSEIAAWCQINGVALAPRHVEVLLAMDRTWLDKATAKASVAPNVPTLPPISQQPLTVALLDAVMG